MKYKVFVDGQEGTAGLKIHEYLNKMQIISLRKTIKKCHKEVRL